MPARSRRSSRGFSLIEAMVASTIFLVGLTGVSFLSSQAASLGKRGSRNTQLAQIARDYMQQVTALGNSTGTVTAAATTPGSPILVPLSPPGCTPGTPPCSYIEVDIEVFATNGVPGSEAVGQLPECPNIGNLANSWCVRVTATDSTEPNPMLRPQYAAKYVEAAYVSDTF
jgi:prepilin-type N-terminal cleavage/methylation domain-containing protein